jgi:hypothetical protein
MLEIVLAEKNWRQASEFLAVALNDPESGPEFARNV